MQCEYVSEEAKWAQSMLLLELFHASRAPFLEVIRELGYL
jgi:hypothetical protein